MMNNIQSIALDKLVGHPDNPNRMSKSNFAKLVRNIERTGRYEPLVVRPCPQTINRRDRKEPGEKNIGNNSAVSACSAVKETGVFQIINGHHRCRALKQLGYKKADVIVWDIDDEQADILLATLNRLGGSDVLAKKLALLKKLNSQINARELSKLLPHSAARIKRLTNLRMPRMPAKITATDFATPLVFFLNDRQQQIVEEALSLAEHPSDVSPAKRPGARASRSVTPAKAGVRKAGEEVDSRFRGNDKVRGNDKKQTKAARKTAALTTIARHFINTTNQGHTGK